MIKINKVLLIVSIFVSLFFPSSGSASPNYYYSSIGFHDYKSFGEIEEEEQKEKIEEYLHETVPGLSVTYREVIDTLIEEGHHVYLTGGVVRDLLSMSSSKPNDVDLDYSGTVEELIAILDRKGWRYTRLPNQSLVIIGDHRMGSIDAMPIREDEGAKEYSLEFSINNIFYHCNSKAFAPHSKVGLEDLKYDRINIVAKGWKSWLYQPRGHRYYKIFRFWKMVGKGYVYSTRLADFFHREIENILSKDPEGFKKELLRYLSRHMYSYDQIYHGSIALMGYDWAQENIATMKDTAMDLQEQFDLKKDQYTHNLPNGSERVRIKGPFVPRFLFRSYTPPHNRTN